MAAWRNLFLKCTTFFVLEKESFEFTITQSEAFASDCLNKDVL